MNKKITVLLVVMILFFFSFEIINAQVDNKINEDITFKVSGVIDSYVFSRSIPKQMTIGKSYPILVFVKNTGQYHASFQVTLSAPNEFFYPSYISHSAYEYIELDGGESYRIKFFITPTKAHIGELNITVNLYLVDFTQSSHSRFILLDSTSASVQIIKKAFSIWDILTVLLSILIIISGIKVIIKIKKR